MIWLVWDESPDGAGHRLGRMYLSEVTEEKVAWNIAPSRALRFETRQAAEAARNRVRPNWWIAMSSGMVDAGHL